MRNVLGYALIRIALWLVLWYLLALAGVGVMLAGVLAVLIAMMISFLFLGRVRENAAAGLQAADEARVERRGPVRDEDAEAEDAALDEAEDSRDDEQDARKAGAGD
ncbi:DUF4229 domain-containing protein [Brachybacterium sp. J153]|uniref:DUF4229 domain-containing protein n=1 Tax=Brachybacterium sp. J153 TaxID=3116488 RepID=UPI002E7A5702|nr:DUF4229 domain-containing protein [Brachybacterium sp. J153]MEE1618156.1 DUF4229 domain-containing protein [Brachybacterium sp. J153]